MTKSLRNLRIRQLDEALAQYREVSKAPPPRGGWIKELRQALRMTAAELGKRLTVSQSAISQLEEGEAEGTITLNSLRKAARALGGELVYAIVPHGTLEEMLRAQLYRVATERIDRTRHTMALEDQRVDDAGGKKQLEELLADLTEKPPRNLWP
jgi:predicted DNA-binding mobile mystery protein A